MAIRYKTPDGQLIRIINGKPYVYPPQGEQPLGVGVRPTQYIPYTGPMQQEQTMSAEQLESNRQRAITPNERRLMPEPYRPLDEGAVWEREKKRRQKPQAIQPQPRQHQPLKGQWW